MTVYLVVKRMREHDRGLMEQRVVSAHASREGADQRMSELSALMQTQPKVEALRMLGITVAFHVTPMEVES